MWTWSSHEFSCFIVYVYIDTPGDSAVKNPPANAGDWGLIPGSGRSSGEGNGNPLQYSCLGNPMEIEAWWATVHGITKSCTQLSEWTTTTIYTLYIYIYIYNIYYRYIKLEDSCFTKLCCFCCTTWISRNYTYIYTLPPTLTPHATPLGCHRVPDWAPCVL